ncbi:TonB-dependent receptor [Bacterioplanes sanyensis]|uniref:TonB-dependent receptor n=1 Tax=Bacterioplanes sanyensis TaxID=1249553 RepID=A0A222FKI0_9GAMM|nr:TonB-dependent receptor [Bacterioplanes sanyensis]ASP39172.1 TonB-dependent receptor [Bacterioplanes sanyensis]
MKPTRLLLGAASTLFVSQLMAGEAVFYVTEEGSAVQDLAVSVNGQKKLVGNAGFVVFDLPAGLHQVELSQYGEWWGEFPLELAAAKPNAEIMVEMIGGEAVSEVNQFGNDETAIGQISGYLSSQETGGNVSDAIISVEGSDVSVTTDNDGFFTLELPRGEYSLNVAHPNYGNRQVSDVRVMGGINTGLNLNLSMAGNGGIEEVVAVGSFMPTTTTSQERDSSAVLDAIGSEQLSRFGDSSAASALKRVAGVSVVGGQFAVVRGMQGRYISSTLNGSMMPSTDPMRRDVPLDLFPASVLGGIDIQKSFTPELPGDSTGGAIRMTTKGLPEESLTKISLSSGLNSRTTFSDVNGYEGGSADWMGIDDGTREHPSFADSLTKGGIDNPRFCESDPNCASAEDSVRLGNSFENIYNVDQIQAKPDKGFSVSTGDYFEADFGGHGYYAAFEYKDAWEARHDGQLDDASSKGTYERTKRKIDVAGYFVYGLDYGSSEYLSKTTLLRKTDDTIRTTSVEDEGKDQHLQSAILQWVERQYIGQQFSGTHYLTGLGEEDQLNWRLGVAQTSRYEPDRRAYTYGRTLGSDNPLRLLGGVERRFSDLTEDALDLGVDYSADMMLSDTLFLKLKTGVSYISKDREVELARYSNLNINDPAIDLSLTPEQIFSKNNIDSGSVKFRGSTAGTDNYSATDEMTAAYVSAELDLNTVSLVAGMRYEDFEQELKYPDNDSSASSLSESSVLPMLAATWRINEDMQLRASASQTVSRPGITERSESAQYDPDTDDLIQGNPNLEISDITNIDVRGEYYFSEDESLTLALFYKDVSDPIERSVIEGDGSAANGYTFANVNSAEIQGIEVDFRINVIDGSDFTGFWATNLSYIDSEVDLSGTDAERLEGDSSRELQGQSEYLANVQFGIDHFATGQSLTLLANYFDDRIYATSRGELAAEIEDGRATFDIVYRYDINESLVVKAKAQNITDSKVSYSRDDREIESYYEGSKYSASVEYIF